MRSTVNIDARNIFRLNPRHETFSRIGKGVIHAILSKFKWSTQENLNDNTRLHELRIANIVRHKPINDTKYHTYEHVSPW